MILSASRRTDIPAFYGQWFINRVRGGYCEVKNPYNPHQVSHVSLEPQDVDAVVFWTRFPLPFFPYLDELTQRGIPYYFLYTLVDYPRKLEPSTPKTSKALEVFKELSLLLGRERVIWRYDPIVFSRELSVAYHIERFGRIASKLRGATQRVVVSVLDIYRKTRRRLRELASTGMTIGDETSISRGELEGLFVGLSDIARENEMEIVSCAEDLALQEMGIVPGKCIDDELLWKVFGLKVDSKKDPTQRAQCGCVVSKDIGAYDTCVFGCKYCYAVSRFEKARKYRRNHDPFAPYL